MNTLHFKYALEVEKTGSITQAADNLYMGQPSLSKAIKELEDTLQIEIFKRSSRGMVPTEEGALFLQYARNVLIQLDKMEQIAFEKDENLKTFRVGLPHSSYLFRAAAAFSTETFKSQALELNFYTLPEREAIQRINEGKLNFAIIRIPDTFLPLYEDYCAARGLKLETIWGFEERVLISDKTAFAPGKILPPDALTNLIRIEFPKQETFFTSSDAAISPEDDSVFEKNRNLSAPTAKRTLRFNSHAEALSFLSANSNSYLRTEPLSEELLTHYHLLSFSLKDGKTYRDLLLCPESYNFRKTERLFLDKIYEQRNKIAFQ